MSTRTRTTPQTVSVDVTVDRLSDFALTVQYNPDGTINKTGTLFVYTVYNIDENGEVRDSHRFTVNVNEWPSAFRTQMKSLRDLIFAHAESQGFIGTGTDTETFDPD